MHRIILEQFRETHDTSEMDEAGCTPVLVFQGYHKNGKGIWEHVGEFYANTPLESSQQVREELETNEGIVESLCTGSCGYYIDKYGEARIVLQKTSVEQIYKENNIRKKTHKKLVKTIKSIMEKEN